MAYAIISYHLWAETCQWSWVSVNLCKINKAGVWGWVGMVSLDVIHRAAPCGFTLTLYSLDVVTVNLGVTSPRFWRRLMKGESSSRVHRVCSAPRHRSSPVQGLHRSHTNSWLSRPPSSALLHLFTYHFFFFFNHPFSFSRGRKYLFGFWFCACPSFYLFICCFISRNIKMGYFPLYSYYVFNFNDYPNSM